MAKDLLMEAKLIEKKQALCSINTLDVLIKIATAKLKDNYSLNIKRLDGLLKGYEYVNVVAVLHTDYRCYALENEDKMQPEVLV